MKKLAFTSFLMLSAFNLGVADADAASYSVHVEPAGIAALGVPEGVTGKVFNVEVKEGATFGEVTAAFQKVFQDNNLVWNDYDVIISGAPAIWGPAILPELMNAGNFSFVQRK